MKESIKIVYLILLECLNFEESATVLARDYKLCDNCHTRLMAQIVEEFIISTKLDPFRMYTAVANAAFDEANRDNFLNYQAALEKEKSEGFQSFNCLK